MFYGSFKCLCVVERVIRLPQFPVIEICQPDSVYWWVNHLVEVVSYIYPVLRFEVWWIT